MLPVKEPELEVFTMAHIQFGIGIVKIAIKTINDSQRFLGFMH